MKRRTKLTPEQQQQVSQALPHALSIARKHARLYGPRLDFEGAVALWLCQEIARFDPNKSSLKTWASLQGHFACRNLMQAEIPVKSRKKYFASARQLVRWFGDQAALQTGSGNLCSGSARSRRQALSSPFRRAASSAAKASTPCGDQLIPRFLQRAETAQSLYFSTRVLAIHNPARCRCW